MAKQDDGKKKDVKPPVVSRREPRVVQDTPDSLIKKGYVPVLRPDGVTEYVKKQDRPKAKQPVVPPKPRTAPSGKPKKVIRPRPTEQPGGESEDVVILKSETKEPEPSRSRSIPSQTGLFGEAVTTAQIRPEKQNLKNYGITTVSYPDVTGKTGATERDVYFDAEGNEVTYDMSDPLKNIVDGKFTPTKTGKTRDFYDREYGLSGIVTPLDSKVNRENPKFQGNLMMEGAQTTRVAGGGFGEIKTVQPKTFKSYMMPKYDASGNIINTEEQGLKESQVKQEGIMETGKMYEMPEEEVQTFTTPKFKKGGLVGKIKGYYQGGTATKMGGFNDLNSESIDKSDVDFLENENKKLLELRNEPVSTPKFKKGGLVSKVKGYAEGTGYKGVTTKKKPDYNKVGKAAAEGLGAYGSSYYAMQKPENSGDVAYNTGMQAVGQIGPIGKVIQGASAVGDQIGEKVSKNAEEIDPKTGKYKNLNQAAMTGQLGGLLNPYRSLTTIMFDKDASTGTKALAAISGGAIQGNFYKEKEAGNVKRLQEEKAKVEEANIKSKQQQALAAREAGEENPSYYTPYNVSDVKYGKDSYSAMGSIRGGIETPYDPNMPTYAKGGTIKGPGTGTSDSILSKISKDGIPAGSFIAIAEKNGLAKWIREKVLGDNPNRKAKFEKGEEMEDDADVAVSNGEHLFTPKEKKKIISYLGKEILEELAPEAEENDESENEMAMAAKGGELNKLRVKNSLLNNIRANAGSGKKPTPEMLKQEKEIKNSYAKGGYVVERSRQREGKTHKVTAPDGTVQYFGDSNLGQHPDNPERKKAFYARHAENLKNNPLFRAFARETWAEGGTVGSQMMDDDYITEMAKGGLTRSKAREILHDKSVRGKALTDKQRKFMGAVASGYVEGYEKGGSVKAPKVMGYAKGTDADGVDPKKERERIAKEESDIQKEKESKRLAEEKLSAAEKIKRHRENVRISLTASANKLKELEDTYEKTKKGQDPDYRGSAVVRNRLKQLLDNIDAQKENAVKLSKQYELSKNEANYNQSGEFSPKESNVKKVETTVSEAGKGAAAPKTTDKTYNELITPPSGYKGSESDWKKMIDENIASGKVKVAGTSTASKTTGGVKAPKVAVGKKGESEKMQPITVTKVQEDVVTPEITAKITEQKDVAKTTTQPQAEKKGVLDVVSGIDPTMFIGPLQAQAGMKMLKGEKRPVFKGELDPRYNKAVERAQYEAQFGLTPEQRFMAEQDIQKSLKDALAQGRSASSVESYNLNRAAANEAWRNKLGLKQADLGARMEKQQYADRMVAERAGIIERNRRQAFEDAMMGFQQRQGAGAQLVGAGLANTIGAYRFNQELKAQKERAGLDWSRNYGQQSSQTT